MSNSDAECSIHELAERAGVSIRTIRFYVNEGLLPVPQMRGRYTAYSDEYVDRLELIRRLKDSFLPLKEIQSTLTSLSWDEVRATLADLRQKDVAQHSSPRTVYSMNSKTEPETRESRSSAQEYISQLLSSTPVNRPLPSRHAPQPEVNRNPLPHPAPSTSQSWTRLVVADGVEIHIRQPVRSEDQQKIDELLRRAQILFSSSKR